MDGNMDIKYKIGQEVWYGSSQPGMEKFPCPDCLETGEWSLKSPAGLEGTVQCPRCKGSRCLTQYIHQPFIEALTIGSIQTNTAVEAKRSVQYMCTETGVGTGRVYSQQDLFLTPEEAQQDAETKIALANAKLEKDPKRAELRYLSEYDIRTSMLKKDELEASKYRNRLHGLLERICELGTYNSIGGRFEENFNSAKLEEKQIKPLQESLVWLDDYCADFLERWREENE